MTNRPTIAAIYLLACACANARSQPEPPVPAIQGSPVVVDVFDPDPTVVAQLRSRHSRALLELQYDHSESHIDHVIQEIQRDGIYQYIKPSLVTYYNPHAEYLTIDVVTKRDAARRMPFKMVPTGHYSDPDGLIAAWYTYQAKVFELLDHGDHVRATQCPILHCLADLQHPKLRELAARLDPARGHISDFAAILQDDADVMQRAAAPYLMAYAADGKTVVTALEAAMNDPSALVRNSVMRVLAEIAHNHTELDVPIDSVLTALNYPATTDRNKAAAILEYLLERPNSEISHHHIAHEAGRTLLAMLRLQQPNNHDLAYKILKIISGQSFAERDFAAWQAWLARLPDP